MCNSQRGPIARAVQWDIGDLLVKKYVLAVFMERVIAILADVIVIAMCKAIYAIHVFQVT